MLNQILAAKESVMTVSFNKKADDRYIKSVLAAATPDQLKDAKKLKELSKEIVNGVDHEMTCHMAEADNILGRSLVIDLNAPVDNNFRQIDHRTINSLIIKDTKYVAK